MRKEQFDAGMERNWDAIRATCAEIDRPTAGAMGMIHDHLFALQRTLSVQTGEQVDVTWSVATYDLERMRKSVDYGLACDVLHQASRFKVIYNPTAITFENGTFDPKNPSLIIEAITQKVWGAFQPPKTVRLPLRISPPATRA